MPDFQTIAAPVVVLLTIGVFIWRLTRSKKKTGCGGSCGCTMKPKGDGMVDKRPMKN